MEHYTTILEDKRRNFANFIENILSQSCAILLSSLQKLMGKCISFSLAFPGAKLYIRKLANAIGIVSKKGEIQMLSALRKKIEFWRLLYPLFFYGGPH